MHTRRLGKSELQISEIGLGCWQFGGDFGPIDADTVNNIIDTALQQGVNFFDTADVYGAGASESYLGEALGQRDDIIIGTKYGRGPGTYPDGYSLSDLRDALRRAQDRLQRDSIDLIQLHCIPESVTAQGDIFEWLRTVQQEGLVKNFGASVETVADALVCLQQDGLTSLQVIFNIFRQKLVEELLPQAVSADVGLIVRLPLASGLLSGKYSEDTRFADTDHRHFNRDGQHFNVGETFAGVPFPVGVNLAREISELLPEEISMAQAALRWILDHEAVSTVIPGASSPTQVQENVSAAGLAPLPGEIHRSLAEFYHQHIAQHIRGAY